jgi:queuine tRNA-ribosyltransferase
MTKKNMEFKILKKDKKSNARTGKIVTSHGVIKTPSFVAVGTKASVKGLSPKDLKETGVQLLFGNTYHLHLRPGEEVVKKFGGVGKFMSWSGPTITDSGGFQVFSLGQKKIKILQEDEEANLVNITEDGVVFRSHIDGSKHTFTPEESIRIQKKLGADIVLCFDECAPHPSTHEYTKKAMERTHRWAVRSLAAHKSTSEESLRNTSEVTKASGLRLLRGGSSQAIYGIIQGGIYKDLREESAKFISSLGFDGIAIGGVSVGESKKQMRQAIDWVYPYLPEEKPRHLLGIGDIDDIFDAVAKGMDTFDCVTPTRLGRYGIVFVGPKEGNIRNKFRIDIKKSKYAKDQSPIAKDCSCYACKTFTRGYINHLFRSQELLAYRLASIHNMFFINSIVSAIRKSIMEDRFLELRRKWLGEK